MKEKQKEWERYTDRKTTAMNLECDEVREELKRVREDFDKERKQYEYRITKLKEEQNDFYKTINEYKMELASLKDFDNRTDKIGALRRHIKETNNLINQADLEMEIQRKSIMPVLDMIHVVAHNPKYVNTGVQTDC